MELLVNVFTVSIHRLGRQKGRPVRTRRPTAISVAATENKYNADSLSHIKVALDILSGATFATPVLIYHPVGYP